MNGKSIYIYCFIPDNCVLNIEKYLEKSGIYEIAYNNIVALVSDIQYEKIEHLDRQSLAHLLVDHQQILEHIMSYGCSSIIPIKLGTIVASPNDVLDILKFGYDTLQDAFKVIDNVDEVDLAVVWNNFPELIKRISDLPDVKLLKEDIFSKKIFDQSDSINIGKLIKEKIDQENHTVNIDIVDSLIPFCVNAKKHETMNDEMPVNHAFLLKKEKHDLFMEMVNKLDLTYSGRLNFKVVGPLPCYSFYTIETTTLYKEDIENAKKIMGIDLLETDYDLKKVYRTKAALIHPDKINNNHDDGIQSFIEINNAYKLLLDYLHIIKKYPENISNEVLYMVKIKD